MRKENSIRLNRDVYRDKVYACWLGKNIGGTMGTPYEGTHDYLDVKGFVTKENVVLPNDDLDLQLVWLYAVEKIGSRAINAMSLGEFWLGFLPANWNEYGIGKINMRRGLLPPLAGDYENVWQDSNGAWIRTEVWASLAPASPDIAAKYAIEDAKVDHGAGEGTYAAAFVAAMQSAAFVISDLRKCIEIGLAAIPENCRMADSIRLTLECYDKGMSPLDTRNAIQRRNQDVGDGWFQAPSNVAYAILGLLYGGGDFKKTMICAINCGDDTDCTAATVGATLGILGGTAAIPEDWKKHIGDDIVTISIDRHDSSACRKLPNTCTELTDRVVRRAPHVLFDNEADVCLTDGETVLPDNLSEKLLAGGKIRQSLLNLRKNSMHFDFSVLSADVVLESAPEIRPNGSVDIELTLTANTHTFGHNPYAVGFRWWLPEGFRVEGERMSMTLHRKDGVRHLCGYNGKRTTRFTISAGEQLSATNRCVLEIVAEGRCTPMYIPVTLLG